MAQFKGAGRRELTKRVHIEGGSAYSYRWIADGYETADITLDIDVEAIIRQLAPRAMGSKSRKSKFMGGSVIVTASRIRRFPQEA